MFAKPCYLAPRRSFLEFEGSFLAELITFRGEPMIYVFMVKSKAYLATRLRSLANVGRESLKKLRFK